MDMLLDGAIGAVSGAAGGRGMSTNITKLNNNLIKKVCSGSIEVAKKGVTYYVSQTASIYVDKLFKPMVKSTITSFIGKELRTILS